ncbi:hypothetical protein ABB02_00906 [Clostridiaceae bacterium JG1575]|nr:hypothetical protein ABB02_00906 [Clostridiaceae bacterium JG1575]
MEGRKFTLEEGLAIASYCLKNNCDYKATAQLFQISEQKVQRWVHRFRGDDSDSLIDPRETSSDQPSKVEKDQLLNDIRHLKQANRRLRVENALLQLLQNPSLSS